MRYQLSTSILFLLFIASPLFSQHNFVLQNMPQIPQASFQNPAETIWMKGYFSIPILSGFTANASTGELNFEQLGINSSSNLTQITSDNLSASNDFSGNIATTILGLGLQIKSGFFSLKISEHISGQITYPKQGFELVQDYYNQYYTIGPDYILNPFFLDFTQHRSYSLGYAHRFKRFSVGANIQYLQGISNIRVEADDFSLLFDAGKGNYLVAGELVGFSVGTETYSEGSFAGLKGGSGNNGIALDIGAVFNLTPEIEFSFAAVNLGGITWKKNINSAVIFDESTIFEIKNIDEIENDLKDKFGVLFENNPIENNVEPYKTPLRQQYTLSGKYYFRPQVSVTATFHHDRLNDEKNNGFSLAVNAQFKKLAGISLAVSKYNKENLALGTGLNLNLGALQLYVISDNLTFLFSPQKAHRLHAQAGINLIFGKQLRADIKPKPEPAIAIANKKDKNQPQGNNKQSQAANLPQPLAIDSSNSKIALIDTTELNTEKIITPVEEKPVVRLGHYGIEGFIKDAQSKAIISDARVSIYKIKSQQVHMLSFTKKVANGQFATSLNLNYPYKVLIFKTGYESLELMLDTTETHPEMQYIQQDFLMTPLGDTTEIVETKSKFEEDKEVIATNDNQQKTKPSKPITAQTKSYFKLKASTSLRAGSNHTNKVIRRLRTGQKVELLEKTNSNWWKVKFNNQTGWVKAGLLKAI